MDDTNIMPQPDQSSTTSTSKWYQKITVEPTMFLYMMAFMITSVVEQAFYLNKACRVNHNYTAEICDSLELYKDIKKEVQVTTSNFHQWNNIAGHIFPMILAPFLGSWSDRRGRKLPLLLGLFGKLLFSLMIIVNDTQKSWPVEYIIYTASIPSAITGADVAIFAASFSYISDVSTVNDRTIRVTILDVVFLSTMPLGVALGSYLFANVVHRSYGIMFAINASCLALAIIYSWLNLKWQSTSKQRSIKDLFNNSSLTSNNSNNNNNNNRSSCCCNNKCITLFRDYFDREHLIQTYRTLMHKRSTHRRTILWIFLIAMFFYTFQRDEKPMLYLYTQYKFEWNVDLYSQFKTFQSTANVLAMLLFIPLLSRLFHFKDTTISMIGAAAHICGRIFFIFANQPMVFYVGGAITGIGPIVGPLLRSMTSKVVPMTERGKVFAMLAVCDNAAPFISGILFTQVYNATIGQWPGIFVLTITTQVIVFILMLTVRLLLAGRPLECPDADDQFFNGDIEKDRLSDGNNGNN